MEAPEFTAEAQLELNRMLEGEESALAATDPELAERWDNFAFGEVKQQVGNQLDTRTRFICYLATLLGCQGKEMFAKMLPAALRSGVSAVEAREVVYQAVAYLGMGRVYPFIDVMNSVFSQLGIETPLPPQAQTTADNRREAGTQAQVDCFGDGMKDFWKSGSADAPFFNFWLADNCFGDYYTRSGLTMRQREMITFCFIAAQGGCEQQLKGHINGNLHVGNSKEFLIAVVANNLPFIGYPRTLNAFSCIEQVTQS